MKNKLNKYFNDNELEGFGAFYKITNKHENYGIEKGKLILVTAINPTPSGEGKTTTLIGINDCLNYFGESSLACLRQPSVGPFFGIKGGATGSGECEIINARKINSGFTGDFYAIETANNLILSVIENEVYFSTDLKIDPKRILWKRCIDINDRSLRNINYFIKENIEINTDFTITAASYLMALFCLAKDKYDFRKRLEDTIVAFDYSNSPVYLRDLKIIDSIMLILEDALKPNVAFSKQNNPIIIHGGPFANIAHGCNTLIALKNALKRSEYVLTEAGFGAELGAEKFIDILCRESGLKPGLIVLTTTLKATIYHGEQIAKIKNKIISTKETIDLGFENIRYHMNVLKKYNPNVCIIINKFTNDNLEDLMYLKLKCDNIASTVISTMWQDGPSKNIDVYKMIKENYKNSDFELNYIYDLNDSVINKITLLSKKIYNASNVIFSDKALSKIKENNKWIDGYYICGAKTPYSVSTSIDFKTFEKQEVVVEDIEINHAAKFVIPIFSKIFLMPGLPKNPNAKNKF